MQYLVKASGYGANFLLNIGPMPNGKIQPEFIERLHWMGNWLKTYGESIYNTKGGYIRPQKWGCITQKEGKVFVHILDTNAQEITLENFPFKTISNAYLLKDKTPVNVQLVTVLQKLLPVTRNNDEPDEVIVLEVKN